MKRILIFASAAIILTLFAVVLFLNYNGFFIPKSAGTSNGQLIYSSGVDENGTRINFTDGPLSLKMMGGSCINCHGVDGKGGYYPMMCNVLSADIRYSALVSEGYNNTTLRRAISQGLDEGGGVLDSCMPRWSMGERDMSDLIGYLMQLG